MDQFLKGLLTQEGVFPGAFLGKIRHSQSITRPNTFVTGLHYDETQTLLYSNGTAVGAGYLGFEQSEPNGFGNGEREEAIC